MWVGKFKIKHDDWILDKTIQYDVVARGIPLKSFEKDGEKFHTAVLFLKGEKENKQKFIDDLKKNKKVKKFLVKENQIFVLVKGEDAITHHYLESFFLIQPVILKQGFEYWEIGSWEREELTLFYEKIKRIADVEIIKLKQEFPSVFIQHAVPDLTDKQREAIEFAYENGYYNYPRKISVEDLAKKLKIPRTTFQEHLRKAESKLMNFSIQTDTVI